MKYKILRKKDYKVNDLACGKTYELYIYPEDSTFLQKNFNFRVSSATCDSDENKFTGFTGYMRYITPLNGNLQIINADEKINLKPFEIYQFDGKDEVIGKSKVRDFNLILKKGLTGSMRSETVEGATKFKIAGGKNLIYNAMGQLRFKAEGGEYILESGDSILFGRDEITIELEPIDAKSANILVVEVEI